MKLTYYSKKFYINCFVELYLLKIDTITLHQPFYLFSFPIEKSINKKDQQRSTKVS